jgi:hypothetical protein
MFRRYAIVSSADQWAAVTSLEAARRRSVAQRNSPANSPASPLPQTTPTGKPQYGKPQ